MAHSHEPQPGSSGHAMDGMDTGVATELGSFGSFVGLWVTMMAAMMLPGVIGREG